MNILDIHSHSQPKKEYQYEVIENSYPYDFNPVKGKYYSLGLHPWYIDRYFFNIYDFYIKAKHPQVLAIGEAGLDKFSEVSMGKQKAYFKKQIQISEELKKPLIIHGVKVEQELLRIKKEMSPKQPWILHGYRGGYQQAEHYIKHGFYLSIGTHFNKSCLKGIPLDKLFIETDDEKINIKTLYRELTPHYSISPELFEHAIRKNITLVFC